MRFTNMRKALAFCTAAALAALLACALAGCGGGEGDEAAGGKAEGAADAQGQAGGAEGAEGEAGAEDAQAEAYVFEEPDYDTLYYLLDEEMADKLIELAKTDPDANWVAAHPDVFEEHGYNAQYKLVEIVARDPQAASFIRHFAEIYPADGPDYSAEGFSAGSPSPDVPETSIPHLYQWDPRWGYIPYGGFCMALSACGPTALTMIYQGLTGDTSISPADMADKAYDWGYVSLYGTSNELFYGPMLDELGLVYWDVPITGEDIVATLREGHPIIANVGIGYFSTSGHFLVLAGVTDDGQVIMNDPYSITRSSQLWDPDFIASETMALYAYGLA